MSDLQTAAPAPPDPTTTEIKISCAAGHRWAEAWPLPMSVFEFSHCINRVASCPTCGSKTFLGWPKENADA